MRTRRYTFQAVADLTRMGITTLIALPAITPNAIAELSGTTRLAISRQLQTLTKCELVMQKQQGHEIDYQPRSKQIGLTQFRKIWETSFNHLDEELLTNKNKRK